SGTGNSRTLAITPEPGQTGTVNITVTVTDALGAVSTDVFVLTVGSSSDPGTPTVATAAGASPNPINGTTANLSVLGDDDTGEANLTYTWAVGQKPAGATDPAFSPNGTSAAKNSIVT